MVKEARKKEDKTLKKRARPSEGRRVTTNDVATTVKDLEMHGQTSKMWNNAGHEKTVPQMSGLRLCACCWCGWMKSDMSLCSVCLSCRNAWAPAPGSADSVYSCTLWRHWVLLSNRIACAQWYTNPATFCCSNLWIVTTKTTLIMRLF